MSVTSSMCVLKGRMNLLRITSIRLRSLASTCEYGRLTDQLIKDRIVVGIVDENVRKRLLQEQKSEFTVVS